jgi:hypothetical protein
VARGGSNDLDNLITICPNHHREYHQSNKFTADQLRIYRTQWIQKCNIFFEIGVPIEVLIKDRKMASKLPLTTKLQFIEQYSNSVIENFSIVGRDVAFYFHSGTQTNAEISKEVITLLKMAYRFFDGVKTVTFIRPHITTRQLLFGQDLPEYYSFTAKASNIGKLIFGTISVHDFWYGIEFFRKKQINTHDVERQKLDLLLVL